VAVVASGPSLRTGNRCLQEVPSFWPVGTSNRPKINPAQIQETGRVQASSRVPIGIAMTAVTDRVPVAWSTRKASTPAASRKAAAISRPLGFTDAARNHIVAGSASRVESATTCPGNRRESRKTPDPTVSKLRMAATRRAP